MVLEDSLTLQRDASATVIPAGDVVTLPEGTEVAVTQALGGSVTVRTATGLFRLGSDDFDALGDAAAAELREREASASSGSGADAGELTETQVWEAMRACFDPEIPVNIVDLGLIYDLRIGEKDARGRHPVEVKMTLTAQGCGMGPVIADDAKKRIEELPQVLEANVEIVWDPPWTPHMISEEGRKTLGLD